MQQTACRPHDDITQRVITAAELRGLYRQLERAETIACFGTYRICIPCSGNLQTIRRSTQLYEILGLDPACGPMSTMEYVNLCVHPDDQARVQEAFSHMLEAKSKTEFEHPIEHRIEYRIVCPEGSVKYVHDCVEFVDDSVEGLVFFGQLHDITKRKEAELDKLASAAKFQSFVERLGGMPYIASLNENASFLYISPKIEKLLGFTSQQWHDDPELRVRQLHPDDRAHVLQAIDKTVLTNNGFSIDYRIAHQNGSMRWVHDEARVIVNAEGTPLFLQGVVIDITERKLAQAELERSHCELKQMIAALDSRQEKEQKRLAHEMHDDLGQLLAAMKMDLMSLQQQLPDDDTKLLQQLNNINELVDTMVTSVRRIIADLPPKVLEDLGLFSALHLLVANFEKRHRIQAALKLPQTPPAIKDEIATPIYRMIQESLNNVAKHARATRVDVQIACDKNQLLLLVADNGIGMSMNNLKKFESFGLIGIRERVTTLNGKLKIDSEDGMGTTLQVMIPLDMD